MNTLEVFWGRIGSSSECFCGKFTERGMRMSAILREFEFGDCDSSCMKKEHCCQDIILVGSNKKRFLWKCNEQKVVVVKVRYEEISICGGMQGCE